METKLKILHLEDLASDAELVERALRKANLVFDKRVVDNREDFIEALRTFVPDIILSDHSLPAFDSLEALKITREKSITTPFILITATVSEEFAVNIMKAGASDYILKDRMQRLPNAILNAMEKHMLEVEREKHLQNTIESEALLRDAEQLASIGSWQADMIRGEYKWSDEMYRIFGYTPGAIQPSIGQLLRHVHPEDLPYIKQALEETSDAVNSRKLDFRIVDRQGQVKYIRSVVAIKRNNEGKPVFLTGFNQDITETKLATESLKTSEANLRTILDNANSAYILIDTDLNIITFNNLAREYAQKDLGGEINEKAYGPDYFPVERRPVLKRMLTDALKGVESHYEVSYYQENGTFDWYDSDIHGIRNNEGEVIGLMMSLTDISERKRMELQKEKMTEDLIQRNKDLEQFAYIISHNLRAPVANILGFSQIMEDGQDEPSVISQCISGISSSVQKLDGVVHDLNHILQIKREINEHRETVKFPELVEDIRISIASMIRNEHAVIEYDFAEVSEMQTIKSYLYSIFYNLITNSIKYKNPSGSALIRICSRIHQERLRLIFEDNGIGMNIEANKASLFGLYKRFHPHIEGKGMGLFMTKTQVESLGGNISVSSAEGKGTTFTIEFSL
jgi:PAS domain S-box-containing protein